MSSEYKNFFDSYAKGPREVSLSSSQNKTVQSNFEGRKSEV